LEKYSSLQKSFNTAASITGSASTGALVAGAGLTAAAFPVESYINNAISAYSDYESQVQYVSSLLGNQVGLYEQIDALSKSLGQSTPFSPSQVASALQPLAQAGYTLDQIKSASPTLVNMSVATREPINEMASTLTQTLSQFQMLPDQAETVGNKIATAANISNTDVRDISESLKYAGTTAEAFNKPLNDTLAILSTLGDYGVKGSQAGTGINEFLARLETPPKAAKKALADYGISIEEIKPSMHSFEEILERLSSSGMDIGSFIKLLGLDAGPKFAALFSTEGLDKYREKLKALQADNSGALQKLTDEQMGTLANIKETINGALENISLKVGEKFKPLFKDIGTWFSNSENTDMISQFMENLADGIIPVIEKIISAITRLMTWFNNLPEGIQSKLAGMTGVGAALAGIAGPLLMLSAGPIYTLSSLFSILEKIAGLKLDKKASEISNIVDSLTNVATITSTTGGSKQATLPDTILGVTDDAAYMAAGIGDAGNSLILAADKYDDDVKKAEQKITKTAKASAKSGALKDIAPSLFTAGSLYGADALIDYEKSKKDEDWSDWAENFNQPYSDLVPSRYQGASNLDSSITKIEESEKKLQALSAGIYGTSILSELDTPDYLKSNVVTQYDDAISKFEASEQRLKSIVKDADIEAPKFSSIGDVSNLALTATSIDRIGDSSKKTGKSIKSELIENMDEWTARDVSALFAEEADGIENIGKKTEGLSSKLSGVKSSIASVPTALNGMLVASTAELSSLEGTFAAVGGPIGIAFAAAIAASAAAYLTNYGGFADNINNVISEAGSAVSNISTGNYKEAGNQAAHAFADGLGAVSDLAVTVIKNIPQTGVDVTKFLGGFNEGMQQAAEGAVSALVAEFLGDLNSAGISANTFCGNVSDAIKGFSWADVGTAVNSLITSGLNTAVDVSGFISSIKSELLSGDWESIGSGIKDLLTNGVLSHGWAGSFIRAGENGVQEYIDDTKEQYKSLATKNSPLLASNSNNRDTSSWSWVSGPSASEIKAAVQSGAQSGTSAGVQEAAKSTTAAAGKYSGADIDAIAKAKDWDVSTVQALAAKGSNFDAVLASAKKSVDENSEATDDDTAATKELSNSKKTAAKKYSSLSEAEAAAAKAGKKSLTYDDQSYSAIWNDDTGSYEWVLNDLQSQAERQKAKIADKASSTLNKVNDTVTSKYADYLDSYNDAVTKATTVRDQQISYLNPTSKNYQTQLNRITDSYNNKVSSAIDSFQDSVNKLNGKYGTSLSTDVNSASKSLADYSSSTKSSASATESATKAQKTQVGIVDTSSSAIDTQTAAIKSSTDAVTGFTDKLGSTDISSAISKLFSPEEGPGAVARDKGDSQIYGMATGYDASFYQKAIDSAVKSAVDASIKASINSGYSNGQMSYDMEQMIYTILRNYPGASWQSNSEVRGLTNSYLSYYSSDEYIDSIRNGTTNTQSYADAVDKSGSSTETASKGILTFSDAVDAAGNKATNAASKITTGSSISPSGSEYTARSWVGKYSPDTSVPVSKLSNSAYNNQNVAGSAKAVDLNSDNIHCVFSDSTVKLPDTAVSKIGTDLSSANKSCIEQVNQSRGLNSLTSVDTGQIIEKTSQLSDYSSALQNTGSILSSTIPTVSQNLDSVGQSLENLASAAGVAVSQINDAISRANSILSSAISSVNNLQSGEFSGPQTTTQKFATGGPVTETGKADVEAGEWILRRDQVRNLQTGGGNTIQLITNMQGSKFGDPELSKDLPQKIARQNILRLKRAGFA